MLVRLVVVIHLMLDVDMTCGRAHDVGQTCSSDSPDVDMTCGRAGPFHVTCVTVRTLFSRIFRP